MRAVFKYELDTSEIENIQKFCNSVDMCSAEQWIGWPEYFHNKSKICYFYLSDEIGIKSFCQINESFGSAHIFNGPVCSEPDKIIDSINEIICYYKKKYFYYLAIQMYIKSGYDTDYIEYKLNKKHDIKYFFNNANTKSSIEIDLSKNIDEIWRSFSKGHRNSINKSRKLGVTIKVVTSKEELNSFLDICTKLCKSRNLRENWFEKENIDTIHKYLINNNKGQILIAKDSNGDIIAGDMLLYQGNTVRMYRGAMDPDRRELPVSHLSTFESIIRAKNDHFKYLDLWGYNHFANENDQAFSINHFKKGFGGDFTFFAKKMNISLIPYGYYIYRSLKYLMYIYRKLII